MYLDYTKPVYERLMGELTFDFTRTLPLQPIASLENKKRKKNPFSHETAGCGCRDIYEMFLGVNKKRKEQGNCITIE